MPPEHPDQPVSPPQGGGAWSGGVTVVWGLLAVACGLLLTAWLHRVQERQWQSARHAAVAAEADKGFIELQAKLRSSELLVRALQTLFVASDSIGPDRFMQLYANLRPHRAFPSLLAIAYARRVPGHGPDRYQTVLVAPSEGNARLLGLDVRSQPANYRALQMARDTDRLTMSAPFALVQDSADGHGSNGITMRLSDYGPGPAPRTLAARRTRARGSIAVSFRVDDLIDQGLPPGLRDTLRVTVRDVTDGGAPVLLFASATRPATDAQGAALVDIIAFGGRSWEVTMAPLDSVDSIPWSRSVWPPGLVASGLLGLLVWSLTDTRRRALLMGRRISQRYRDSEERFRTLNEVLPALVLLADAADGRITYANQAARRRLGAGLEGARLVDLLEVDEAEVARRLDDPAGGVAELALRDTGGERFWASVAMSWLMLEGRAQWVMVASDITEQKALTELLGYQATHDDMTGLINRREFERRLQRVAAGTGDTPPLAALLYVDLDQFKLVNDTSGHVAGDQLLTQVATLMRAQLGDHHVLARLGGDEFGVILTGLQAPAQAVALAERLRLALEGFVFPWEDKSYMVTISLGGVLLDRPGLLLADLLAAADTACYMAKEQGRNRAHFYSEQDTESARRRSEMEWANRLRWAVQEQRFVLAYQEVRPLAAAAPGVRIELLLRFRDEDGRLVSPGAFIPAAERYGLMPRIDRWVIETALAHFERLHPDGPALRMAAINLSGASIEEPGLAEHIVALLRRHRIAPERVCFEITETVAVRQLAHVAGFVSQLRAAGCKVALDDFGVGMSSFSYLKNLPVDIIKIDGSFIRDMLTDPISHAMVRAVTDIGHRLDMQVVAEWVADQGTLEALRELGVDLAQGHALHVPQAVPFQQD